MRSVLGIAVFLTVFGCGILDMVFGFPQMYIERDVQVSELVDTWNITSYSESNVDKWVKDSRNLGIGAPVAPWKSMTLNSDGTCQVKLERAWLEQKTPLPTDMIVPDTLPCTWKLTKISNIDNDDVSGVELELDNSYIRYASFYIFEKDGALILWNLIGYVDRFKTQEFMKSPK